MLVVKRSWLHLAFLARSQKPATRGEWAVEMERVHRSVVAKHLKLGAGVEPPPELNGEASWPRIVVAAKLAA
eukprot:5789980-Alexandrium_andersonii.AAC.1